MNMLDKLDYLMGHMGLNKHTLSEKSGIPYSTISNFYKLGYENMKISTLIKLSVFFNVPIDYLVSDQFNTPKEYYYYLHSQQNESSFDVVLLSAFHSADLSIQTAVLKLLDLPEKSISERSAM